MIQDLIYAKAVNEKNYSDIYVNICYKMFKLYNKKTYPNNPEMVKENLNLYLELQKHSA